MLQSGKWMQEYVMALRNGAPPKKWPSIPAITRGKSLMPNYPIISNKKINVK